MPKKKTNSTSFRVGRVLAFLRGRVWYLRYQEEGRRRQPRVGPDRAAAKQMAAEINAQLENGTPSALGFEPITIAELRDRWLDHHENVRRSSLQTIRRYRSATEHLLTFVREVLPVRRASDFRSSHAEQFVRYLRSIKAAPNGHPHAHKRSLSDTTIKFILETCSTVFNYAQRNRHLPPYVENPFLAIQISRIPIEDAKPIMVFTPDQERALLEACDRWQFPLFLTLLFTGMRPGEAVHLLLPDDLALKAGWIFIRNKPKLGWQVKTRNERDIPLADVLRDVLRYSLDGRTTGPVFRQRRCSDGYEPPLADRNQARLEHDAATRIKRLEAVSGGDTGRTERSEAMRTVWRDIGALKTDVVRIEFMRLMKAIGLEHITAPKTFRHTFATILQNANVDPLIRNELMGHMPTAALHGAPGLVMTAIYTHTQPETKRRQLQEALACRPGVESARTWLRQPDGSVG